MIKKLIEALNRPNKKELTTITWEKKSKRKKNNSILSQLNMEWCNWVKKYKKNISWVNPS